MSNDFSHDEDGFVNIYETIVKTNPWGSETKTVYTRMSLAEVLSNDLKKQLDIKEIITRRTQPKK